ncbi:hypothetical protein GCM10025881_34720 [Pseudolysinimonas kribbensis]|uniref:Uncharacterized protein n=1 Tax=Pseudolysinimonas kribbensis TaxID=433641 RepID=A0ABQ6KB40_9MICO|nr:hypothetical protein GCM10025881_34720 [Pseudolysinimonas kribbensis]
MEDRAARGDAVEVDEGDRHTTELARGHAYVIRKRLRGEHLLEERSLDRDVTPEVEGGVAEDAVDEVTLIGCHGDTLALI